MLAQRRRRWANIRPTLDKHFVLAGVQPSSTMRYQLAVIPQIIHTPETYRDHSNHVRIRALFCGLSNGGGLFKMKVSFSLITQEISGDFYEIL